MAGPTEAWYPAEWQEWLELERIGSAGPGRRATAGKASSGLIGKAGEASSGGQAQARQVRSGKDRQRKTRHGR